MEVDSYCQQNDNVFSISTKQQPYRDGVSQRKTPEFRDKKNVDAILDQADCADIRQNYHDNL